MPKRQLKVFRTPIGFHDAYVAAPSRKAALEAWGAEKDLFASGSAELVTDPALTAEPLAAPGTIVKRARGTVSEHLKAAGSGRTKGKAAAAKPSPTAPPETSGRPPRRPPPRPDRSGLDKAEAALESLEAEAAAQLAAIEKRETELRQERQALKDRQRRAREKLEAKVEDLRARYEDKMERWRREI